MHKTSETLQTWHFYVIFAVILACAAETIALQCYDCSYTLNQNDATCITNTSAIQAINCTKKYCLTHNANKVSSFLRDCVDKSLLLNGVKTDALYRTYYRTCQQNLCNGHNGRVYNKSGEAVVGGGGGGLSAGTVGGNHNAVLPGKSGCCKARTSILCILVMLVTVISVKRLP